MLKLLTKVALIATMFVSTLSLQAASESKEFNAGEMIIHHVMDAHEIHFATLNEGTPEESHISIPLPIILWTDNGLQVFSSSKFHNEHHYYNGFVMEHDHIYYADENLTSVYNELGEKIREEHMIKMSDEGKMLGPIDLSITKTVAGVFLVVILMFVIFNSVAKSYKARKGQAPKGLQSLIEPLIVFLRDDIAKPSIGHHYEKFMPFLITVFFFIFISNILGLIPFIGGFNITGNIAVCLVLASFTFIITTVNGNKTYWGHLFMPSVPAWLYPLMIPIEILGVFTKPFVLMLRLFANITAGHIIILSFISLIFILNAKFGAAGGWAASPLSLAFGVFINTLELLVAFLQAYVFTLLSAIYFGSAVEEHHH